MKKIRNLSVHNTYHTTVSISFEIKTFCTMCIAYLAVADIYNIIIFSPQMSS